MVFWDKNLRYLKYSFIFLSHIKICDMFDASTVSGKKSTTKNVSFPFVTMMKFSFLIPTKLPPHQFQRFQCSPRTLRTLPPRAAAVGWRGRPTATHHNHTGDQSQQWSPAWREHPMFDLDFCMDVGFWIHRIWPLSIKGHFHPGLGFLPNCERLSWKWSKDSGHVHTLHDCLKVSAGNWLAIARSNMQRNHSGVPFSKLGTSGD